MKIADLEKKLEDNKNSGEKSSTEMRKRTEEISRLEVQLAEKEVGFYLSFILFIFNKRFLGLF